ncbi:MAG: hypothetical protein EHM78_07305 [Myxococcaceae bacterium]|nr:MAG: hypothetical protein EHM78_07305 [Myxococcaceae bacterium]
MRTHVRAALSACLLLLAPIAVAQTGEVPSADYGTQTPQAAPEPPPPPEPGLVRRYAVGPRFIIAPGVFIPSSGSAGFTLGVVGGYGFDMGPVILTPAVMAQGSWSGDWSVYTGLGGLRVTLPVGNFGPYIEGGIGYGHVGGPFDYSAGGLALRAGAGFIMFFSPSFALGVSVTYDTIVDTPYKTWIIAPLILLAF